MISTVELLYKQYKQLRDFVVEKWHEQLQIPLSNSEWSCLNAIVEGASSIPEIMVRNEITKQAAHKVIRNLEEKKLLTTCLIKSPKIRRQITLTELGIETYQKSLQVQHEVEQQLQKSLGDEDYQNFIRVINKKWL